ncbi:hypothetical protein [Streptomyces sp. NPDC096193]|uniref:hypothetical protein n=1 Tax=Streptomyces sp. NPDC096193 TaxID=3155821 RepID=UPI003329DFE4
MPLFGALTATHATVTFQDPLPAVVWMPGPSASRPVRSALVPDAHGGTMDAPEMRAGVTCHPVFHVPGALPSPGERHARRDKGEASGVAVECA